MIDLEEIAINGLESTEANALVLGYSQDKGMFWCLPLWECENDSAAERMAAKMVIEWADKHGTNDIQVVWVFK